MSKRKHDEIESDSGPCELEKRQEPANYIGSGIINVLVGQEKVGFEIHKQLLFSQSPYCAALQKFSGDRDEVEGAIELPDVTVKQFKLIFNWLYSGKITKTSTHDTSTGFPMVIPQWIQLYQTADILMMSNLQNDMVDLDLSRMSGNGIRRPWSLSLVRHWYDSQVAHTPYFRLFLQEAMRSFVQLNQTSKPYKVDFSGIKDNPEAMASILDAIADHMVTSYKPIPNEDRCKFHIHVDGKDCKNTGT